MPKYVIRYRYPGTVNNAPVGLVYVRAGFGKGVWSYSKQPDKATQFNSREEAECTTWGKQWPEAEVLEFDRAQVG